MKVGFCSGQSRGRAFSLCFCFCCSAVLKAFLECALLWLNFFFALPSFDIPGQGCLHSGQARYTSGENRRLENLAKYFVAALSCGSGCNMKSALSGSPPLLFCNSFSPSEFGHSFCCLWSFKKLDCFSVIKITHTSDLQIATSQGERQLGAGAGNEWRMRVVFTISRLASWRTVWVEGHTIVHTGKRTDGLDQIPKSLFSLSAHHPPFFIPTPGAAVPFSVWKKN